MSSDRAREILESRLRDLAPLQAAVAFDFGADGRLVVDAARTPPEIHEDADDEVACTVRVSLDDFEKLARGELNPTLAYTFGKLKVDGSMGVAMKLATLLEE